MTPEIERALSEFAKANAEDAIEWFDNSFGDFVERVGRRKRSGSAMDAARQRLIDAIEAALRERGQES